MANVNDEKLNKHGLKFGESSRKTTRQTRINMMIAVDNQLDKYGLKNSDCKQTEKHGLENGDLNK